MLVVVSWNASVLHTVDVPSDERRELASGRVLVERSDGRQTPIVVDDERHLVRDGERIRVLSRDLDVVFDATETEPLAAASFAPTETTMRGALSDGASLLVHVALAGMLLALHSAPGDDHDFSALRELIEEKQLRIAAEEQLGTDEAGEAADARPSPGASQLTAPQSSGSRPAIAGRGLPRPSAHALPSRAEGIEEASSFGMIGLLSSASNRAARGADPWSGANLGSTWGPVDGLGAGFGELDLSSVGEGAGGRGEGIGVGDDLFHGASSCGRRGPVSGCGSGGGGGRLGGKHKTKPPTIRLGVTHSCGGAVTNERPNGCGRLPPEVVQRVVRQNFGRFRACYASELRSQPGLNSRVTVSFVIGRDGSVSQASAASDSGDGALASCIAKSFYGLSFPQPDGGVVHVTYPLVLSPG